MKNSVPLVRHRWGAPRSKSHVLRVSPEVHDIVSRLPDRVRRSWVDSVIIRASGEPDYIGLVLSVPCFVDRVCGSVATAAKSSKTIRSSRSHSLKRPR